MSRRAQQPAVPTLARGASIDAGESPSCHADSARDRFRQWFSARGWSTFDFQEEVWQAMHAGASGLIHAPTGTGKTLAAWLGAILRLTDGGSRPVDAAGLRVVWITPLRALAADTLAALEDPLRGLWPLSEGITVGIRTGDTSAGDRRRLRDNWPTALVTTPETLSILLSLETSHEIFEALDTVIVDEWHELVSTKRGVQTELALSRLRAMRPGLITWGLSATLTNLDEATAALVGLSRGSSAAK